MLGGALLAGILATTGFWLWPTSGGPLPEEALGPNRGPIYIVRIEPVADASVQALIHALQSWVPTELRATDQWRLDERHTLSWEGDIYDVDYLLDRLADTVPRGARVVAITDQAMHDEDHWWLYGKGGEAAIISTAHLWAEYDVPDQANPIFRARLAKVGVHELGHCFGFFHCTDPTCVMSFSWELEMLDATRPIFCRGCLTMWRSWN
jgi:predicted Zn-dependent protease